MKGPSSIKVSPFRKENSTDMSVVLRKLTQRGHQDRMRHTQFNLLTQRHSERQFHGY